MHPRPGQSSQAPVYPQHLSAPLHAPHTFRPGLMQTPNPVSARPCQPSMPGFGYQHSPTVPYPSVRQLPPGGLPNTGQSYLFPPSQVPGGPPLPRTYSHVPQNSQHLAYSAPGPHPPVVSHRPETLTAPRGLHPPTFQGRMLYGAPAYHLPQQPASVQSLPPAPPLPPPPPSSSLAMTVTLESSVESKAGNSPTSSAASLPSLPLLQPLSYPPSAAPSPPLPISNSDPHPSKPSENKFSPSDCVAESRPLNEGGHNISIGEANPRGSCCHGQGSDERVLSSKVSESSGMLPLQPPKPAEDTLRKIKELCQLIAENGSSYEDITRKRELKNPKFQFLFGGEPGSEAAIAYEYFMWMKKQRGLAFKLNGESPRSSGTEPLVQANFTSLAGSRSHSDSDMEMEVSDDITQSNSDQADADAVALSKKVSNFGSVELGEQEHVSGDDHLTFSRSSSGVDMPVIHSAEAAACPSISKLESSVAPGDGKSSSGTLYSHQVTKDGNPFRLLQEYASGDSSENYEPQLKNSIPKTVPSLLVGGNGSIHEDIGSSLEVFPKANIGGLSMESNMKHENQASVGHAISSKVFQKEDSSGGAVSDFALDGQDQKDENKVSSPHKIDKFGRLVKEDASDSDSDDSRHSWRHNRSGSKRRRRSPRDMRSRSRSPIRRSRNRSPIRSRSRSRSRSPIRSRSRSPIRRRSPTRRRKRSRSCSWSPRNRRSRSRSPAYSKNSSGITRRDTCFDFFRGRCYRGATCRYLHHDLEKGDRPRNRRKWQNLQHHSSMKNSNTHEELENISRRTSDHDGIVDREMQHNHDACASKTISAKDGDIDTIKSYRKSPQDVLSSLKDFGMKQSQTVLSGPAVQYAHHHPQQTDDSPISDSLLEKTSISSTNKFPASGVLSNTADSVNNPSHVSMLSYSASLSPMVNAPHSTQSSKDMSLIQLSAAYQSHCAPSVLPNQNAPFPAPVNTSWESLPPLPPPYNPTAGSGTAALSSSSHFQQSHMHPKDDSHTFTQHYTELFGTQACEVQHQANPPAQEASRSFLHAQDFSKPLPGCNLSNKQYEGPGPSTEDYLTRHEVQGLSITDSSTHGSYYTQSLHLSQESSATKMQCFPGDSLPARESMKSNSQIPPYMHQQKLPYALHHSGPDRAHVNVSLSRYLPDVQDTNQASSTADFGRSITSTHYNPYASTFDQPLVSRFSSDDFRQEKDSKYTSKYNYCLNLAPTSGQGVGVGQIHVTSSPNITRVAGKNIQMPGTDQYDPLFDSIEPSSALPKKYNLSQNWEASNDSSTMSRFISSSKPIDIDENKTKNDYSDIAAAPCIDNEAFGETADAEVGDVESGSQSNANAIGDMDSGEMEIDQIKSPGKSKKNKEHRLMKLFRVAIADFVKEVLNPSWRQGNMSKETFKTVVKKTVDKVSGSMKSHQIPKSTSKINHYIDSSKRKLTKLVMGYVDKYSKG